MKDLKLSIAIDIYILMNNKRRSDYLNENEYDFTRHSAI